MIRLTRLDNVEYQSLRREYLKQLVENMVVAFDVADVLDDDTRKEKKGKTAETYEKLRKSCKKLSDYLFDENGNVHRKRLQLLLVGPEEMPRSFGGMGECPASMRSVFEHIISGDEWSNGSWHNVLAGGLWTIQTPDEREAIQAVFRYPKMNEDKGDKDNMAYWIVNRLKAETCPFCNRMYTKTLMMSKNNARIRPELDHFYPKSKYPYLAVSLFNLIPICSYCNKQKSDYAEMYTRSRKYRYSIIYPYDEAFNDEQGKRRASFRLVPGRQNGSCLNYYKTMIGESTDFTVEIRPTNYGEGVEFETPCTVLTQTDIEERFSVKTMNGKVSDSEESTYWTRVRNSINRLRLEKLYNTHELEIALLLKNRYQYNKIGVEMILRSVFEKEELTLDDQVINWRVRSMLYFGFLDQEQWGYSPLNKLKRDILEQMDEMEAFDTNDGGEFGDRQRNT